MQFGFKCALFIAVFISSLGAVEIVIDYRFDDNNFFDTDEKREAIEAVADYYSRLLDDTLLRIDPADFIQADWTARTSSPSTGALLEISNLVIPEDVILIFVGGYPLEGQTVGVGGAGGFSARGFSAWFERIEGRGNPGANANNFEDYTDFAPWGGSVAFDTASNWNFSLTENRPGLEFIGVALHEIGHVLGIGSAESWVNQLENGTFTGEASTNSIGFSPPADGDHFLDELISPRIRFMGQDHGTLRPVQMLASFTDFGVEFDVLTDLDLTGLVDIGWEVVPDVNFRRAENTNAAGAVEYDTVSFNTYQIRRTQNLDVPFANIGIEEEGDGLVSIFTDPAAPTDTAFYQLSVSPLFQQNAPQSAASTLRGKSDDTDGQIQEFSKSYKVISCDCH